MLCHQPVERPQDKGERVEKVGEIYPGEDRPAYGDGPENWIRDEEPAGLVRMFALDCAKKRNETAEHREPQEQDEHRRQED